MKTKIAIIFLFITSLFFLVQKANALTPAHLYMVFDKTSYEVGEEINITINLDQFIDLNEVKIQIKLRKDVFEPIQKDGKYFYFTNASIFQSDVINDFVDDAYLRLRLIKNEAIDSGYYSSYKNNVCHVRLLAKQFISNIYDYFTLENYQQMGISVYLFNTKDEIISFDINYNERMVVRWPNEKYTVEVYSEMPNFKEDITVINRDKSEYEYLIEKQVDTLLIGLKTVHVGIYDKSTADYMVFSKAVEIVDTTAPVVEVPEEIKIYDHEINQLNLLNYIQTSDNYDTYLTSSFEYFQSDYQKLEGKTAFEEYLKHSIEGYFICSVEDTSKNVTRTDYIKIKVQDTTAPIINEVSKITINDSEVDYFSLRSYFQISDGYDKIPEVVFEFIDVDIMDEQVLIEKLLTGHRVEFNYYGIDISMNKTPIYNCYIEVIDTTPPIVQVSDLFIEDVKFKYESIDELVRVLDNFYYACTLEKKYFINHVVVSMEEFQKMIVRGHKGEIVYQAIDNYQNKSEMVTQTIQLIDTTKPVIKINNIEPNKKYTKIDKLDYEIVDNFDGCTYIIFLDNQELEENNFTHLEVGKHTLKIVATDINNNITESEIEFEIIVDNLMGCNGDFECYIDNYLEVFIIVITLIIFVIIIIIVKFIFYKKRKKA